VRRTVLLLLAALAACSSRGGSSGSLSAAAKTPPPGGGSPTSPVTTQTPPTATARILARTYVPDADLILTADVPSGSQFQVERALPGMSFTRPIFLTNARDGSGRLFVVELRGTVYSLASAAAVTSSLFLDISSRVHYGTEEGLYSIAFHPQFKTNGKVFAVYSTGTSYLAGSADPVRIRLSRFTLMAGNPNALDPSSEVVLLEVPKHYYNHNGGTIAFGPDGYLYMSLGDGGCCGDPEKNAQNLGSLKGKILRLDVDNGSPYGIPQDNPFVATNGAAPEIWAYGLRNPWRFSFDRATGRLWAGDVGENTWEEVDLITKGGNYGWSAFEGDHVYDGSIAAPGALAPMIEYDHDSTGTCVIGGYVYNGQKLPGLQGWYVFADYTVSAVWAARYDGSSVNNIIEIPNSVAPGICSFGEDEAGEIYLLSYTTGKVYTITAAPSANTFPQTLSATGLFSDLATQTLRPEMLPYTVVEPHWADFADQTRGMLLPHLDPVQWTPSDGFGFPVDSILMKNFFVETVQGDPKSDKIVETRLLINTNGEWRGYSYEWNDQGTDALLLDSSKRKGIAVVANGQPATQAWYFPSRSECLTCHTQAAGYVLGLQTGQLNCDYDYTARGGTIENQLSALSGIGVFAQPIPAAPAALTSWVNHQDPNATLDQRARSYLAANCSHCHRPDGGPPVNIDLRFDTPLANMNIVGVAPIEGDYGIPGANIVTKGNPQASVLYLRVANMGALHMPPIATTMVDQDGAQLIADWITNLP